MKKMLDFNSIYIREFRPNCEVKEKKPDIVYHYTSPDVLLSIINGNSVRFSDMRFMNDKSESLFFVKRLIEFSQENKNMYPLFCEAVNVLLAENDYDEVINLNVSRIKYKEFSGLRFSKQRSFIFCTCKDADSLNMWNYYASNGKYTGYNIGFSVQKFLETFDVQDKGSYDAFTVYYGSVLYTKKQHFSAIEELAKETERFLQPDRSEQAFSRAAVFIRSYIEVRGLFFKDSSFKSENEYRFLLSIADKRIPHDEIEAQKYMGQYNKKLCEGFCVKNGIIVPYMQVTIPDNSISRITVSPMTEYEIAKDSIKELLGINKRKSVNNTEIPIYKSQIPIRY